MKRENRRQTLMVSAAAAVGLALLALLFHWLGWGSGYLERPYRRSEYLLDDTVTLVLYGKDRRTVERAADAAFAEMRRLESIFDRHDPSSELASVNRRAREAPVKVSPELFQALRLSKEMSASTGGAFDATLGPLNDLWDVKGRRERGEGPPGETEIEEALERCGDRYLVLDEAAGTVYFSRDGMVLDLGGMAKGYAADAAARVLDDNGVKSGIIDMVSTIVCLGDKPREAGGPLWNIEIIHPRQEGDGLGVLSLRGGAALSTSGDYQRFFEYMGERYHHIFDPATGYPVRDTISCTVLSASCDATSGAETDAISTALFVLGNPQAVRWAEERGYQAILVDSEGRVWATPGMDEVFRAFDGDSAP